MQGVFFLLFLFSRHTTNTTQQITLVYCSQTEWSKSGQYTSVTDLSLTPFGVKQMEITGEHLIGDSHKYLINPEVVRLIITSPRKRAIQTKELLFKHVDKKVYEAIPSEIDEDIREWEYGDYEGLLTKQIKELRAKRGLPYEDWTIWQYGCENGEDYKQVTARIDVLIARIQAIHKEYLDKKESCDIMIVAHGHILRCFAARWIGLDIHRNPRFMLDAGGVCVLSYQHHNIKEPALYLTGAFTVPLAEEGQDV